MSMIRRAPVGLLLLLAAVVAAVIAASGAVTGTQTYVNRSTTVQDLGGGLAGVDVDVSNRDAVVELGDIDLAATGVNTKTLVYQGVACGNTSMSWDDSPAGSAYKVTNHTSWNANTSPASACDLNYGSGGEVPNAAMWGPNGCYKAFPNGINLGQTIVDSQDCTGTASTKTQWSIMRDNNGNLRYACGYKIPGGGGYWTTTNCAV